MSTRSVEPARAAVATQLRRWRRWLVPGIGLKRWLAVVASGVILASAGMGLVAHVSLVRLAPGSAPGRLSLPGAWALGGLLAAAGGVLVLAGLRGTLRSIDRVLFPTGQPTLVEVLREQRALARGMRVVALGGGTGLATLLRGLKRYSGNITAIVTVFDDGGSSGRLRQDLGVLPPGDIRDCLVALAEAEPLMTQLFEYRFQRGALDGHAFGNLFIASLAGVTGDLERAVREASRVLKIRGRVLPTTVANVVLCAEYEDGSVVEGESRIPLARKGVRRVFLRPAEVRPVLEVLEAIAGAELIAIGPGSLFTSVIPNLLVHGMTDAVRRAAVPRIYICNVMTQPGETDGFTASAHVRALLAAAGPDLVTHVVVNTRPPASDVLRQRYAAEGSYPVEADFEALQATGVQVVGAPLMSEEELLRHDPDRLAAAVMRIAARARRAPGS